MDAILIRGLASGLTLKASSTREWVGVGDGVGREDTPGYRVFSTVCYQEDSAGPNVREKLVVIQRIRTTTDSTAWTRTSNFL